ncbi:hypothetical protein O3P69_013456 [Scylla paramamosain]|uniref:Uncharacterized protein n=1 Tax=Scylla paramamosain TaxID=85552 RepID=A0AAW0S9V2_SCYPA
MFVFDLLSSRALLNVTLTNSNNNKAWDDFYKSEKRIAIKHQTRASRTRLVVVRDAVLPVPPPRPLTRHPTKGNRSSALKGIRRLPFQAIAQTGTQYPDGTATPRVCWCPCVGLLQNLLTSAVACRRYCPGAGRGDVTTALHLRLHVAAAEPEKRLKPAGATQSL